MFAFAINEIKIKITNNVKKIDVQKMRMQNIVQNFCESQISQIRVTGHVALIYYYILYTFYLND